MWDVVRVRFILCYDGGVCKADDNSCCLPMRYHQDSHAQLPWLPSVSFFFKLFRVMKKPEKMKKKRIVDGGGQEEGKICENLDDAAAAING